MNKTARLYKIEMLIRQRGQISFTAMLKELEISRATLKRDLGHLRDQLGAPIVYVRDANAYRFAGEFRGAGVATTGHTARHELPGLWFNERELYSLLMAHQLLSEIDSNGMLSRHLQPLLDRIHELLGPGGRDDTKSLMKRVRIISALRRPVPGEFFERVGEALLRRRRLHMRYLTRGRGQVSEREVSPQRLVHYKNTWYLDAWCHTRDKLLRFALDAIQVASVLEQRAKDVALKQVEAEMDGGYGIYAGGTPRWATLHFSAQAAPWISREQWHPDQQGRWLVAGGYELKLPYVDETELVMDVLRQGEQVQVIEPSALREAVRHRLGQSLAAYG